MKNKSLIRNLIIISVVFINTQPLSLAEGYDPSATVYRFQKTMAKRGNAASQFKLGLMLETGSGVEQSLVDAIIWYNKAADQNYKPAVNRLTYIEIKKSGFKHKHNKWVENLQADARVNEGEALFLLGQMYSEGTGINKDLTEALRLLRKASRGDIPGADAEIFRIEKELTAQQKKTKSKKQKLAEKIALIVSKSPGTEATNTIPTNAALKAVPKKTFITAEELRKQQARGRQLQLQKEREIYAKTQQLGLVNAAKKTIQNSKVEQQSVTTTKQTKALPTKENTTENEQHPMDIICGGDNMLLSGCR